MSASKNKTRRHKIKDGFKICTRCGAVVVTELWEKHAHMHWPLMGYQVQLKHFTDTYEVEKKE